MSWDCRIELCAQREDAGSAATLHRSRLAHDGSLRSNSVAMQRISHIHTHCVHDAFSNCDCIGRTGTFGGRGELVQPNRRSAWGRRVFAQKAVERLELARERGYPDKLICEVSRCAFGCAKQVGART